MAEIWAAAAATVVAAGAAYEGSQQAGRAAQRGANTATAESARQYDQTRADTAPLRSIQGGALDQLARLYGWAQPSQAAAMGGDLIISQGGIPTVDSARYQADPAYRYAWDKTLATEQATRPGWNGQPTYNMKGTNADFARLTDSLTKNIAEYQTQHPGSAPGGGTGRPDMTAFTESPDYQFNLGEGQKGLDRALAAQGRSNSGAAIKEGVRYASGMASGEYGRYVDRLLAAAGLGTTGVSIAANAGAQSAANIGAYQMNAANTRANGYMQAAEGVNNAVQGGISNYLLYKYLNQPQSASGWSGPR